MGEASLALFQGVFAVLMVLVNLGSLQKDVQAQMYQAVVDRYNGMEYFKAEDGPESASSIADIESPSDLFEWLRNVFVNVTFAEQDDFNSTFQNWDGSLSWNSTLSPATVGGFNRILMARMTAKRWDMVKNQRGKFKAQMPNVLAGTGRVLSHDATNVFETQDEYCRYENETLYPNRTCYEWTKHGSYAGAGGYAWFIDPMKGDGEVQDLLLELQGNGIFDLRLGTFVVDMMVYNTNVNKFMHVAWAFAFDFSGNCQQSLAVRGFSLDMNGQQSSTDYLLSHIPNFILSLMVMCFLSAEFRSMWDMGLLQHFRRAGAVIDIGSLALSSAALLSYWYLEMDPALNSISFDNLTQNATNIDTYVKLENAGRKFEDQAFIIALNLLIVFMRAVMLVAQLQSNLGLIIKVLDAAMYNLVYFVCLLLLLMTGFVIFAWFTFGVGQPKMSNIIYCLYQVVSMLAGVQVYQDIEMADPVMAPIFYFTFYIIFFFGMLNMFVSILMSGYDIVDHQIKHKLAKGEKEINPIVRVVAEVRRDVLGRFIQCIGSCFSFARCLINPIIESAKACLANFDSCPRPNQCLPMFRSRRKLAAQDEDEEHADTSAQRPLDKDKQDGNGNAKGRSPVNRECILMVFFMLNFIILMFFQVRGTDSYYMAQATLYTPMNTLTWEEESPHRIQDLDGVQNFEEVFVFAQKAILGLYSSPTCAIFNKTGRWDDTVDCDSKLPVMQLTNRIAGWNVGFLNTTFVRLTIQPACFVANPNTERARGFPILRATPEYPCAEEDCVSIINKMSCRTAAGMKLQGEQLRQGQPVAPAGNGTNATGADPSANLEISFSMPGEQLGSHALLGGYAVSLGATLEQAQKVLNNLNDARWFSKNAASMVFDWITYNGNLDMFSYNKVTFSLLPTGSMEKQLHSQTFPMNVQAGGNNYAPLRFASIVLFSVYAFFVLFYIGDLVRTVRTGYKKSRHKKGATLVQFMKTFLTEDAWIVSDTVSLLLSIVSIVIFLIFALSPFRTDYRFTVDDAVTYVVPNEDVKKYNMAKGGTALRYLQDDWYMFLCFETLENWYSYFLILAALNSFFISIKVIKYVGDIPWVQVFSGTINAGKTRNIYFMSIIILMQFGFALFFYVVFGHVVPAFETIWSTMLTLFEWMTGTFDLEPLLAVNPGIAMAFFLVFIVAFFFVAQNLFLATMLNTYAETVGNIDVQRVKHAMERDRTVRLVEYPSKKILLADVKIEVRGNEVLVKELSKDGLAAKHGVCVGHQLFKVNRERDSWRREDPDDIMEEGIREDRDGFIRIVFKDASKKRDMAFLNLVRAAGVDLTNKSRQSVKPTVKNFWRNQGAITWVHREISTTERDGDEDQDTTILLESMEDGEAEGGDDEAGQGSSSKDGPSAEAEKKAARVRTKRRLDALLFSRWPDGRRGSQDILASIAVATAGTAGPTTGTAETGADNEDELEEEEWDMDELRDRIEKMPVTGQEAWLDCLVAALERQMDDEYIITEVLRTSEMQDMASKGQAGSSGQGPIQEFYRQADDVLKVLEYKASKKYYQYLQMESEQRQELLRKQNEVLHEYACELEKEFTKIMESIHSSRAKKDVMLAMLAGLLDRNAYSHLDKSARVRHDDSHMRRLTIPWEEKNMAAIHDDPGR